MGRRDRPMRSSRKLRCLPHFAICSLESRAIVGTLEIFDLDDLLIVPEVAIALWCRPDHVIP
jgi:hypothetical protein